MGGSTQQKTALGVARARFIEALPRKSKELGAAVASLKTSPEVGRLREEMRRRLHALYASAQVFREETLANAVKAAIERLDRARDTQQPLAPEDLEALKSLASSLPALGSSQVGKPSVVTDSLPIRSISPRRIALRPEDVSELSLIELRQEPPAIPPLPPFTRGPRSTKAGPLSGAPARAEGVAQGRGLPDHQTLVSVLVLDDRATTAKIKESLSTERFEVLATDDPDEALRLARSSAPDLVLVDHQIALSPEIDFIARLRGDPLTDLVPVFVLIPAGKPYDSAKMRDAGVDHVVFKPVDGWALLRAVGAMLQGPAKLGSTLDGLSEATVDELVDKVAQEIRFGLSESLQTGRERKIPLGEGHEILAAVWAAVGRIRAHITYRSAGGIRFRDGPRRGGPSILALVDGESSQDDETVFTSLEGRRFLVVDDDPGVRWFFTGLLKEAGASVLEASNGQQALESARLGRPDVVISDILMPGIDGFSLCQEFKRDVILSDVPIILISWKEDLLQRMRELRAGASGYLRKEAGTAQILERIGQVLRPIARLEAQLRTGGEVRGRIEDLGVLTLLETVGRERPDARITVRDASNLFEVDFREREIVALTKTATDGSFVRGKAALQQLLAARSGRFTAVQSQTPVRALFHEPLSSLLSKGANQLAARLDAVSDAHLVRVGKIILDEEVLTSALSMTPRSPQELKIIERLRRGESPKDMIVEGRVAPRELEACLDDLTRRSAIARVLGPNGEDRIAEALRIREERPGTLFQAAPVASGVPEDAVVEIGAEQDQSDLWQEVDRDSSVQAGADSESITERSSGGSVAEALQRIQEDGLEAGERRSTHGDKAEPSVRARASAVSVAKATQGADSHWDATANAGASVGASPGSSAIEKLIDSAIGSVDTRAAKSEFNFKLDSEPPIDSFTPLVTENAERRVPPKTSSESFDSELNAELELDVAMEEPPEQPRVQGGMIEQALREELERASLGAAQPSTTPEQTAPSYLQTLSTVMSLDRQKNGRTRRFVFLLGLVLILAVAYLGYSSYATRSSKPQPLAPTAHTLGSASRSSGTTVRHTEPTQDVQPPSQQAPVPPASEKSRTGVPEVNGTKTATPAEEPVKRVEGLERSLPFIDRSWGVDVPEGQGLLVVEWKGPGRSPDVTTKEGKLGRPPFAVALPPGRQELKFSRNGKVSIRRLTIRRGTTRIVYPPEPQ